MKTFSAKKEDIEKKWYLVDARDKVLGRLACELAKILMGKGKPVYTSHVDTGDYVIVINADKVCLTGKKWDDKVYYHYSGYPGGMKSTTAKKLREEKPADLLELAVRRMLPKSKLGRDMYRKLKVYASSEHPHTAQKPEVLEV